jgi:FkbM family methyltransferase
MIIIDVGAHTGQVCALPFAQNASNLVYAIEPIPALADQLRSHHLPNLQVFQMVMGPTNQTVPFHINQFSETSSLLQANCVGQWQPYAEQLQAVQTIEVTMMRLDTFMAQQAIVEVELLKIDAQGYDLQVLYGAGEAIHCVKKIVVEAQLYPLYEGSSSKEAIVEYLTSQGFYLAFTSPQTAGLEENLEFVRVNRYPLGNSGLSPASDYKVRVPHIGIFATPPDDHVGQLLEQGTFEGPEQAFLWLYLRPGDVFFDCGAHTGLFSRIAAHCIGSQGQIVGFEPNPACFELYQLNLATIGVQNFTALNVGLSDRSGWGDLWLGKPGMSAFSTFATEAKIYHRLGETTIPVKQCCLDDVIAELHIATVALTKMDVEGWEAFVLQGARQSIQAQKLPLWMIEFTETNAVAAGSSTRELRALIESLGYTLCRFDVTRLQLIPEPFKPAYPYENLFAVMDLAAANERLAKADVAMIEVAKDIITRWDTALLTTAMLGQITHERHVTQDLRQQVSQLATQLAQPQIDPILHRAELAEARIKAMESSKFWKLRSAWFRVKKWLPLPQHE